MEKVIVLLTVLSLQLFGHQEQASSDTLQKECLSCHKKQQVPNALIYKRYLMKYSTDNRIQEAMFKYLKNPQQEDSVMPTPFFGKFPMQEKMTMDDQLLNENIQAYLKKYNIKKKLRLEE